MMYGKEMQYNLIGPSNNHVSLRFIEPNQAYLHLLHVDFSTLPRSVNKKGLEHRSKTV